jgi:glycosyltransferase involved in cell wall biosynthesis
VPAARKKKIPMVFEVRDLWPEMPIAVGALKNPLLRFAARRLEHWAYHNAEAVVALSPGMKEGVVRTGYPREKVAVIPNSSDNAEFEFDAEAAARFRGERDWLGDKPLLVYTGAFGSVNGVGYLVPVAKELLRINSDIRILLVGDGAETDKVARDAEYAGVLGRNLFMEGKLPKKEIPALLSAATMASVLFIDLPEMRPNSANKFFDALASGTPVLLNYGGWMHDLVSTHGCGLALWQRSPAEVALKLESKMHDSDWLSNAERSARQLAEKYFDRDKLANQLVQVLQAAQERQPEKAVQIAPGEYS